jgi:hypothetical protein
MDLESSAQFLYIKKAAGARQSNSTSKSGNSQKMRAKFLTGFFGGGG